MVSRALPGTYARNLAHGLAVQGSIYLVFVLTEAGWEKYNHFGRNW
jgi:hypothetical protein